MMTFLPTDTELHEAEPQALLTPWYQFDACQQALQQGYYLGFYCVQLREHELPHWEHRQAQWLTHWQQQLHVRSAEQVQWVWQGTPYAGEGYGQFECRIVLGVHTSLIQQGIPSVMFALCGALPPTYPMVWLDMMPPPFPMVAGPKALQPEAKAALQSLGKHTPLPWPSGVYTPQQGYRPSNDASLFPFLHCQPFVFGLSSIEQLRHHTPANVALIATCEGLAFGLTEEATRLPLSPKITLGWLPRLAGITVLRPPLDDEGLAWFTPLREEVAEALQRPCLGLSEAYIL
ncbi:MAG: hypothetical protein ACKO34_08330 [Vampirovibrionales bacterium]